MTIPSYKAQGTASSVASGVPTPTLPTHADDDYFVLWVTCNPSVDASVSTPTGWALIGAVNGTGSTTRLTAFGMEATSNAMANPTLQSFTGFAHAVVTSYQNKLPGSTITVVQTQGNGGSGVSNINPNIVTNMTDSLVVFGLGWDADNAGPLCSSVTAANLISPTERYDAGTTLGDGGGIGVFDGQCPPAIRVGVISVNLLASTATATVAFALTSSTSVVSQPVPFFRATGTVLNSASADVTLVYPGTSQNGDLALAIIETPSGVPANLVSGQEQGYTLVGYQEGTGATNPSRITVYKFRMNAAPGSLTGPTVDFSSDHLVGCIITYGGLVASGSEIEVYAGADQTTSGTTYSFPDATTITPSALILNIGSDGVDTVSGVWSGQSNANLSYLTERLEARTTSGNGGGFVVIDGAKANVGAVGNTTGTISNSSGGRITLVLRSSESVSAGIGSAAIITSATATATAIARGAGSATVVVSGIAEGSGTVVGAPDGMIVLLPSEATVTQRYQTTVTRCHDGSERRVAIATKPFETLALSYVLSDDEARYLRADFARAPAQRRLVAHPQHELIVTAPIATGSVVVTVGTTTLSDLLDADRDVALVDRVTGRRHYARVASKTGTTVTLDTPVVAAFESMRTSLVALVECTLRQPIKFARRPQRVTEVSLTADRYYVDPTLGTGAAALDVYGGLIVMDLQIPIQRGTAPEETDAVVDSLSYGMGVESYFSDGEAPPLGANQREILLTIAGAAARQRLRLFLHSVRGRQKAFLLPTFRHDLVVAAQPVSDTLIVLGTYYTDVFAVDPVYHRLRLELADGSALYRTVLAYLDNGDETETLTLDADVDTGVLGLIAKVSFLEQVRLASDEIPWDLRSGSGTTVTLSVVGCQA